MAATEVTVNAEWADGKALDVLSALIAKREKFIRHETTEMAVVSTAINILKAVRSATAAANVKKGENDFYSEPRDALIAGFKSAPGSPKGRRVVRAEGGHEMNTLKTVNLAGKYKRRERVSVFIVVFKYAVFSSKDGKYSRYYCIAKSKADVDAWAKARLNKYIQQYRGMAKWILGQAMYSIARTQRGASSEDLVGERGKKIAAGKLAVEVAGDGFNDGKCSVYVADLLDYATLALKGGASTLNVCMMKAANKTAGIIKKFGDVPLDVDIPTPFPEVATKKKAG